jgi:hypothetical protein
VPPTASSPTISTHTPETASGKWEGWAGLPNLDSIQTSPTPTKEEKKTTYSYSGGGGYTPPPPPPAPPPIDFQALYKKAMDAYRPAMDADIANMLSQLAIRNEARGLTHSGIPAEMERRAQQQILSDYSRRGMSDAMSMAGLDMQNQKMLFDMFDANRKFDYGVYRDDRLFPLQEFAVYQPYFGVTESERMNMALKIIEIMAQVPGAEPLTYQEALRIVDDMLGVS